VPFEHLFTTNNKERLAEAKTSEEIVVVTVFQVVGRRQIQVDAAAAAGGAIRGRDCVGATGKGGALVGGGG
jgi:hypothetical protein